MPESCSGRAAARGGAASNSYDLLEPWELSQSQCADLLNATAAIADVYKRVVPLVQATPHTFLREIGIPGEWIPLVQTTTAENAIARLDLVQTNEGYKLLEVNAD